MFFPGDERLIRRDVVLANKWDLGLAVKLTEGPRHIIKKVDSFGFKTCQVGVTDVSYYTDDVVQTLRDECEKYGVGITMVGTGPPGRIVYDFLEGPETIGLVALDTRRERADAMMEGADWAAKLGVNKVHGHLGFLPEDCQDAKYKSLIPVLREIAQHCQKNGQMFIWETGPETPTTLLRAIEDTAESNVAINFDPANLLMYGKANPVDAMDILGPYVAGVHIKDGLYPTNASDLGKETIVGEGAVDFPKILYKLREYNYDGPLIIECEFQGDRQLEGIKQARHRVEAWMQQLGN